MLIVDFSRSVKKTPIFRTRPIKSARGQKKDKQFLGLIGERISLSQAQQSSV
jgi:hypothetical protein